MIDGSARTMENPLGAATPSGFETKDVTRSDSLASSNYCITVSRWRPMSSRGYPMCDSDRLLLRVEQAAQLAAISRSHAYVMIQTGQWPCVRMNSAVRIPHAWLQRWVDQQIAEWEETRAGRP